MVEQRDANQRQSEEDELHRNAEQLRRIGRCSRSRGAGRERKQSKRRDAPERE